jgi:RNA polymerase sigma factor (sigma-70 family)
MAYGHAMIDDWLTRVTLIQRVKNQHDEKSWREFVRYYEPYIYNILRRMQLNHHDAQDVAQSVNLKIWDKLPEFNYDSSKGRFRSWLCSVAVNEARMFLRSRRRCEKAVDRIEIEKTGSWLREVDNPEIEKLAEEEWITYVTALAWKNVEGRIDPSAKRAFELVSKGRKPDEVAAELGLSVNTVYVYKKRAQDILHTEIVRLNRELD